MGFSQDTWDRLYKLISELNTNIPKLVCIPPGLVILELGWAERKVNTTHYSCKRNRAKEKHAQNGQNRKRVLQEAFQPATQHHTEAPKRNGFWRGREKAGAKKESTKKEREKAVIDTREGARDESSACLKCDCGFNCLLLTQIISKTPAALKTSEIPQADPLTLLSNPHLVLLINHV